jgi:tetratricopeptide (TPR) repeat protein
MGLALRLLEQAPEPHDADIAEVLADLGLVYFALGDLPQARTSLERALEIHERVKGPHDFLVAGDLMRLGWVLRSLGELERVRKDSVRALRILEQALGPGHALEAMGLSLLCRALWQLGEVGETRRAADRALEALATSDLFHPLMCSCWYNLGQVQLDLGNLDRAEQCIGRALEIGERAYGTDHSLSVVSLAVRGAIQERRGLLEEARTCFERSLASAERTCNRLPEEIAIARSQLADVLRRLGKPEDALARLRHTRDTLDRVCGERSRLASHLEAATAALLLDGGQLGEARRHAERGLSALDPFYPGNHPYRIPVLNLLARIELEHGNSARARDLAGRALSIGDEAFDGAHPDLAETHGTLAAVAGEEGDGAAERSHRERHEALRTQPSGGPLVPSRRLVPEP